MEQRPISVSTVAYDGYSFETAYDSLSKLGIKWVEPAYIKGYMAFAEEDFEDAAITTMRQRLEAFGLQSVAVSAHMDCGVPEAIEMLARRLRYTKGIGARFTITNSTTHDRRDALVRVIEATLPLAEELGVVIALENPGHGNTNIIPNAQQGAALIRSFDSPHVCMNYDTANALTCLEGAVRPETDIDFALPVSGHVHLKDVVKDPDRWRYVAIGAGQIDYQVLLYKLAAKPDIPVTLELPLRLRRRFHHDPERRAESVSVADIEAAITHSWNYCRGALSAQGNAAGKNKD